MKIHQLSVEDAFKSLQSGADGLPSAEASRRLQEYGFNRVQEVPREFLMLKLFRELTHFFAIILWVAAALVFVAEVHQPGQGMATLGYAIVGVIVVNGAFSFWQEYRAERALHALQKLLPDDVEVVREGAILLVPAIDLVPGDVIILQEGDGIPADARVVECHGLRVNNATVTGESMPQGRTAEPQNGDDYFKSANVVLSGTLVVSGKARALVFATGGHSTFGEIAKQAQTVRERLTPMQAEIVRLTRIVAVLAFSLGAVFYLIGRGSGLSTVDNLMFAVGIIAANVPEGLLPTVTLALAMGSQRMARRQALVRHLPAVETLGAASVICTDKTGTLTLNEMTAKQVYIEGHIIEAQDTQILSWAATQCAKLFEAALNCNNLDEVKGGNAKEMHGDPMETALVELAHRALPERQPARKWSEVPFDAQRRRMSTLHKIGGELCLYLKGAPEVVLELCRLSPSEKAELTRIHMQMAEGGRRVLGFASKTVSSAEIGEADEVDLNFLGFVGLEDPPRPEVREAIHACRTAGVRVIMITGDHPRTALGIAREVGMVSGEHPIVMTGDELRRLSLTQLQLALDAPEIHFARVTADQKMRIVSALKSKGHIVAVTGDGVNDAPALRKADIGVAMGRKGTDVARESADIVLLDDNFASIVAAIEEGRAVFSNIRKFLTYILTSNIPEVIPYICFVLFKIPLPLTILQILAVDLGTDMLPALALGAEPPRDDTMQRPPRSSHSRLLDGKLLSRAYLWLGMLQAAGAMAVYFLVLGFGGWEYGEVLSKTDLLYREATTGCLTTIVVMQVANLFICRSSRESVFKARYKKNVLIYLGIAAELTAIILIVYTPWGQMIFGTAPIPVWVWFAAAMAALGLLFAEEIRKAIRRKVGRKPT